jgi:solute carrier family 8 (sodium/calcium exchanger)
MFLGVAIIADIFMIAIEHITSKETIIWADVRGEKRRFHVKVWNYTVANLTLMALGSSAPEIILNIIEIFGEVFFSGSLGPSTIVGSAAFNLLIISAVCVMSIPPGEVRFIKSLGVFYLTSFFSVFAYLWLLIILQAWTPNVVTVEEASITFLFCPVLVVLAYLVDKGWHTKMLSRIVSVEPVHPDDDLVNRNQEVAKKMREIKNQHGENLSDAEMARHLEAHLRSQQRKTRAWHRVKALHRLGGGRGVSLVAEDHADLLHQTKVAVESQNRPETSKESEVSSVKFQDVDSGDDVKDVGKGPVFIGFSASRYACLESEGKVTLTVNRVGPLHTSLEVDFETRDHTAKAGMKYVEQSGTLRFGKMEASKTFTVSIVDNNTYDGDLDFYVVLTNTNCVLPVKVTNAQATITIVDDDDPGIVAFNQDTYFCRESDKEVTLKVKRTKGCSALVSCKYNCEDGTAKNGHDYHGVEGVLEFQPGEQEQTIVIPIVDDQEYEKDEYFRVLLTDPMGGVKFDELTDGGGECCIAIVKIFSDDVVRTNVDKLLSMINTDAMQITSTTYKEQFVSAWYCRGSKEEQAEANWFDWVLHILSLPFKLIFALCPPPHVWGGWQCFFASLIFIGILTAVIADVANLLGCCIGMDPSITAITLVALGTSLPDTFASRTAALDDPFADASIGNIMGSNSVNVFLGLGLPWLIGSIYWAVAGTNSPGYGKWQVLYGTGSSKYPSLQLDSAYPNAAFAVPAGNLGFSVLVFALCAITCIGSLILRRKVFGGELGGPRPYAILSSGFFVALWFLYVTLSIMKSSEIL